MRLRLGGLKIEYLLFRSLQIEPTVPRYTNTQAEFQTIEIYYKIIMYVTYLGKLHEHLNAYDRIVITSDT